MMKQTERRISYGLHRAFGCHDNCIQSMVSLVARRVDSGDHHGNFHGETRQEKRVSRLFLHRLFLQHDRADLCRRSPAGEGSSGLSKTANKASERAFKKGRVFVF